MRWTVPAAYLAAMIAGVWLFRRLTPLRAMLAVLVGGWLLLPIGEMAGPTFISPTKLVVIEGTILVGTALAAWGEVKWPRLTWWDLPMIAWVMAPAASQVANNLGWKSAGEALAFQLVVWGIPYLIGRTFLISAGALLELSVALIAGAVLLAPLALYESIFHPGWHELIYGWPVLKNDPRMPLILNMWGPLGYRPSLFLPEGPLEVSFYYAAAGILAAILAWRWRETWVRRNKWFWAVVVMLVMMPFVLRPFVGMIVVIVGLAVGGICMAMRARRPLVVLMLVPAIYIGMRVGGIAGLGDKGMIHLRASPNLPQNYMMKNYSMWSRWFGEDVVLGNSAKHPWFGFGTMVTRDWHNTGIYQLDNFDAVWTYSLLRNGWVGESALWLAWGVACVMGISALGNYRRRGRGPAWAAVLGIALVVMMQGMDWLMNISISPIWIAGMGGLVGVGIAARRDRRKRRSVNHPRPLASTL